MDNKYNMKEEDAKLAITKNSANRTKRIEWTYTVVRPVCVHSKMEDVCRAKSEYPTIATCGRSKQHLRGIKDEIINK